MLAGANASSGPVRPGFLVREHTLAPALLLALSISLPHIHSGMKLFQTVARQQNKEEDAEQEIAALQQEVP